MTACLSVYYAAKLTIDSQVKHLDQQKAANICASINIYSPVFSLKILLSHFSMLKMRMVEIINKAKLTQ